MKVIDEEIDARERAGSAPAHRSMKKPTRDGQLLCLRRGLLSPVSTVIRTTSQSLAGQCRMWKHGNNDS